MQRKMHCMEELLLNRVFFIREGTPFLSYIFDVSDIFGVNVGGISLGVSDIFRVFSFFCL